MICGCSRVAVYMDVSVIEGRNAVQIGISNEPNGFCTLEAPIS